MYSFSGNCAASVLISTFICLWVIWFICIFSGLVHIVLCSRIGRLILEIYKFLTDIWVRTWGTEHIQFCFGNNSFISGNTLMETRHLYRIITCHSFAVQLGTGKPKTFFYSLTVYRMYSIYIYFLCNFHDDCSNTFLLSSYCVNPYLPSTCRRKIKREVSKVLW